MSFDKSLDLELSLALDIDFLVDIMLELLFLNNFLVYCNYLLISMFF